MQLTVLGSGTVAPSSERTAPAYWLEADNVRLLLDCGAGTLHRAATFGVPWADVTHIALTHFHIDHWGELPHFLFALRWGVEPPRRDPLVILGPRGIGVRLAHLTSAYGEWVLHPEFPLEVVELDAGAERPLADGVVIETHPTPHTAESLAYGVRTETARLVYTGDTGPSETLATWAAGCDLLLCECSLPEERAMDQHMTPAGVARLARTAGTKRLVLTHVYPVFGSLDPATLVAGEFEGTVETARDGDRFTVTPAHGVKHP
ncbi:MAG: ribonuclease Z [Gemmatimonadota bacterium]|nr:ribonuclease Z [Gemmatimonadota bacterium]